MVTTQLPNNLLIGNDRRLYVKKTIGPADSPLFTAIVPAGDHDLPAERIAGESVDLTTFPKLSMHDMIFVHAFFAEIYEKFKSEAIVLFHRDAGDTEYTVIVPESFSATAASLTYDHSQPRFCKTCRICSTQEIDVCPRCGTNTMIKTRVFGTAHSHGSMSAFHSGTDDAHEKNQTGFHITFGNVNQGLFSVCPSFVVALNGYTDKDGFGKRHYPGLGELVDLPDPLSQEEQARIQLWTSVLFNEEILRSFPNEQAVVLERRGDTLMVVFTSMNQDYAQHWCSLQPRGRDLQVLTASKVKEALSHQRSKPSSTAGSGTTDSRRPYGRPATRSDIRRMGQAQATQTTGTSGTNASTKDLPSTAVAVTTDRLSAAGTATKPEADILTDNFVFSHKLERAGIIVCLLEVEDAEIEIFNMSTGEAIDEWDLLDGLSMTSFDDGVFATWTVQYSLQQFVRAIDDIVPSKTAQFPKDYDDCLEALSKVIGLHVGSSATDAAKELLTTYTVGKLGADTIVERAINRVISVADIPAAGFRDSESDFNDAVAAQLHLVWSLKKLMEKASVVEIIPSDTVDAIDAELSKVVKELVELYQKELVTNGAP